MQSIFHGKKLAVSGAGLFAVAALLFLVFFGVSAPVTALVGAAIFLLLIAFQTMGDKALLFLLGLLFPFEGLRLYLPPPREGLLAAAFPDGVDQPLVNVLALLFLVLLAWRVLRAFMAGEKTPLRLPLLFWVALFCLSGFLSALFGGGDSLLSLKYVLYPIAFSYVAFVILPASLAKSFSEGRAIIGGMVLAGAFSLAVGIGSLFLGEGELRRVTTLPIFGIWPLGRNHNLLAETLVATAPLAAFFALTAKHRRAKFFFLILGAGMALVALLTFARTAWIALVLMAIIAAMYGFRSLLARAWKPLLLTGLLVLPLLFILVRFSGEREVRGSTAARFVLTTFALHLFQTSPIVGVGPGTFVSRLGQTRAFTEDFGDPLDSHGVIQKILAEQGGLGFLFFALFLWRLFTVMREALDQTDEGSEARQALLLICLGAFGMIVYELFNTTYYSAKLWLPIGTALLMIPFWTRKRVPSV